MIGLLVALLWWTVDRIEPPWAVLIHDDGREREVRVSGLPPDVAEGDRLATLRGPRLPATDRLALAARIARLAGPAAPAPTSVTGLATAHLPGHRAPMAQRHQDHYARRARAEGYRARSIYKLEEINRRVRLFRRGQRVLDLGCAPGSWTQYAAGEVGPSGEVVGIDLKPVSAVGGPHVRILCGDIFETPPEELLAGGRLFDVVMSDMAPSTSGNRFTDHVRSIDLCGRALDLARIMLRPGGAFVCKAFEGSELNDFVQRVQGHFGQVKRVKPQATRDVSVELFVVGLDFQKPAE
ncbi:MAG: SAM-dependent methyltransferase [bacterium]